jgi:polo-like kinase 1
LISGEARVISFIDKDYELYTWSLASLTQTPTTGMSKSDRKRIEQVLYKVQYARWVQELQRSHFAPS